MSLLLPEGVDHLGDCPFPLHYAILTALRILGYEEFPKDERPPREIWTDRDKIEAWWKEVERKRKERYGDSSSSDEDESGWEQNGLSLVTRG